MKPITLEEFSQRFVDRMVDSDVSEVREGVTVREYAGKAAPAYWAEAQQHRVTPEECAGRRHEALLGTVRGRS